MLFLAADGSVLAQSKASSTSGGFAPPAGFLRGFGRALARLGDLDGDGFTDFAVSCERLDFHSRVWLFELDGAGAIQSQQILGGGAVPLFSAAKEYGASISALGDVDGNGVVDFLVGAPGDDLNCDPYSDPQCALGQLGTSWVHLMDATPQVIAVGELRPPNGLFGLPPYAPGTRFGDGVAGPGDLDLDGVPDAYVGAPGADQLYVLTLQTTGALATQQSLSAADAGFAGAIESGDEWARSLASTADLDGDGKRGLLVGAPGVDVNFTAQGQDVGGVWMLLDGGPTGPTPFVPAAGQPLEVLTTAATAQFDPGQQSYGTALAALPNLDLFGSKEILVGDSADTSFGPGAGALRLLLIEGGATEWLSLKFSGLAPGLDSVLAPGDAFGASLALLGDLDGDGASEVAVGAPGADAGRGAVIVLSFGSNGSLGAVHKIGALTPGLGALLQSGDDFGRSLAAPGDLNGDGVADLIVGAPLRGGAFAQDQGRCFTLFLDANGDVSSLAEFASPGPHLRYGSALAALGDLDGDGRSELAVGAPADDGATSAVEFGQVWIVSLASDGTPLSQSAFGSDHPAFGGLSFWNPIGSVLAPAGGDLNGDGVPDLWLSDRIRIFAVELDPAGVPLGARFFGQDLNGFDLPPAIASFSNHALAPLGDQNGDGKLDLLVGNLSAAGQVHVLRMEGALNSSAEALGCTGFNPPGSLSVLSGAPVVGGQLVLGLDNPLGTQAAGSATFLALEPIPGSAPDCGFGVAGWGMAGQGAPAELHVSPANVLVLPGAPWAGAGQAAAFALPIPALPALVGSTLVAQGMIVDATPGSGAPLGVSVGIELVLGP